MAHDFAKQRAARTDKGKKSSSGPWLWLASGIVLGALVSFLVYLTTVEPQPQLESVSAPEPKPKPAGRPKRNPEPEKKPQFDFYEILPGGVGPGQRSASGEPASASAAPTEAAAAPPAPVDVPEPTPPASTDQTLASVEKPTATAAATRPTLLLQAGSFRSSAEADRRRGEIILLGYDARIERSTLDGNALFRVQIGPFANSAAQADARRALQDLGFEAIEIGKSP